MIPPPKKKKVKEKIDQFFGCEYCMTYPWHIQVGTKMFLPLKNNMAKALICDYFYFLSYFVFMNISILKSKDSNSKWYSRNTRCSQYTILQKAIMCSFSSKVIHWVGGNTIADGGNYIVEQEWEKKGDILPEDLKMYYLQMCFEIPENFLFLRKLPLLTGSKGWA